MLIVTYYKLFRKFGDFSPILLVNNQLFLDMSAAHFSSSRTARTIPSLILYSTDYCIP